MAYGFGALEGKDQGLGLGLMAYGFGALEGKDEGLGSGVEGLGFGSLGVEGSESLQCRFGV